MIRNDVDNVELVLALGDISRCFKRMYSEYLTAHVNSAGDQIIISYVSLPDEYVEIGFKSNIEVINDVFSAVNSRLKEGDIID